MNDIQESLRYVQYLNLSRDYFGPVLVERILNLVENYLDYKNKPFLIKNWPSVYIPVSWLF